MTYNIADMDLDVADRDKILSHFQHIPATKVTGNKLFPHGVGVYFCDIPEDLLTGLATIDYKEAEENYGYVKVDLLHNSVYDRFNKRSELFNVMEKPINWDKLNDKEFVKTLPHIGAYYNLIKDLPVIDSIEKLAKFIAIIRPGKAHLIPQVKETQDWNSIDDVIWVKPVDGKYYYKKTHSISYAVMISILLR